MAFATIQYFSRSLQKASAFNIIFPDDPAIPPPWATFYLLHGLSDDHTIWQRRTSIERYVGGFPLAVVMPDGGRGWYTNALEGYAHEDDLIKDVVRIVDATFPVKRERSGRCIGGLSMGGYGAIKVALKHLDMFASVNSHSGALGFLRADPAAVRGLSPEFDRIFGKAPKGGPEDPFAIVEKVDHGLLPAIQFDCGTSDFLLDQNRSFHAHLDSLRIAHEYREHPGGHDWGYWDEHVREALAFHVAKLGLKKV